MKIIKTVVSIAALAVGGLGALIVASPASAAAGPVCLTDPPADTIVTAVTNRHDHGLGSGGPEGDGNWAVLTFTRTTVICVVSMPAGGPWQYLATVTDSGTLVTLAGATLSPGGDGHALLGGATGTFTGGYKQNFSAPQDFDGLHPDGGSVSGDSPTTSHWVESFYDADSPVVTEPVYDWEWVYKTCVETWTDNETTEEADYSAANDITGLACPPPAEVQLPTTGSSLTGIIVAGGGAVFLGALLVAFAMRRRRVHPQV